MKKLTSKAHLKRNPAFIAHVLRLKALILIIILCFSANVFSQKPILDSLFRLKQAAEQNKIAQNDTTYLKILSQIAFKYYTVAPDSTIIFADFILEKAKTINHKKFIISALRYKGIAQRVKGNYPEALKYLFLSLQVAENSKDSKAVADLCNSISNVLAEQNKISEANLYLRKSLKLSLIKNDLQSIAVIYANIADNFLTAEEYDSAQFYLLKSIETQKNGINPKRDALRSLSLAKVYIVRKERDSAEFLLKNAVLNLRKMGEKRHLAEALILYAKLQTADNQHHKSVVFLSEAEKIAGEIQLKQQLREAHKLAYENHKALQNFPQALRHHELFKHFSDSLLNVDTERKTARIEADFYYSKREDSLKSITLLKNFENEQKLAREKNIKLTVIIAFFVLAFFTYLIFVKAKKEKKLNNLLTQKNNEILSQKDEIEKQSQELQKTYEKLLKLEKFRDSMRGMLVHDLKNPLNNIYQLAKNFAESKEKKGILTSASQMLILLSNILDLQKYEETGLKLSKEEIRLKEFTENTLQFIRIFSDEKRISVQNYIPENVILYAEGNILHRILENLLTNAVKFTPARGIVEIFCEKIDENLFKISISDSGKGIPEEKLSQIFLPFEQAEKADLGKNKSTGLGLTFCKIAVEAHGGEIGVRSEVGKGAVFFFTMPGSEKGNETIKAISKVPLSEHYLNNSKKEFNFSEPEILEKNRIADELKAFQLYETAGIFKIISENKKIPELSGNLCFWLDEILFAVENFDEEYFRQLLEI